MEELTSFHPDFRPIISRRPLNSIKLGKLYLYGDVLRSLPFPVQDIINTRLIARRYGSVTSSVRLYNALVPLLDSTQDPSPGFTGPYNLGMRSNWSTMISGHSMQYLPVKRNKRYAIGMVSPCAPRATSNHEHQPRHLHLPKGFDHGTRPSKSF